MDEDFRRFADECPDAVMVTDRDARIGYVNVACEELTGYAAAELIGGTPARLKSGTHEADFYRELWAALQAGREFRAVFRNRRKDGGLYYEEKIIRPLGPGFVSFGRDVTERARELEKLAHAATHDSLTDLPNRRLFLDRFGQAQRHAARHDETFSVAIMDLDRFRETNNRFGHAAGDAVLVQLAGVLRSVFRASDHVVRWGGEEFLVVVRFVDRADAPHLAEKVRAAIAAHGFRLEDGTVLERTCSLGFAAYPFAPERPRAVGWEEIVDLADLGLYAAKRSGRNRWVGVEAGEAGDPEAAVKRFRENPETALAKREVRVRALAGGLRWA